ncbi:hypothetical protein METSCH_B11450 [Metschnikowia aff. pulcherrima]|uniref:Uncharacterized protein n=1 Tax=Metschnikowia aff. pulcherrima TaxID=2163413 RepID=A0A4P6XQ07_9ASCO|nr:hypothetical protein METSCH_B11450 [Metschnikowia aff. pulcherrima]
MRVYQSETGCYQIISGAHTRTLEILERNPEYDHPFCFRVVEQARDLLGWQLFFLESQSLPKESMVFVLIFWRISLLMPKTSVLSNIHILVYRSNIDSRLKFAERKKDQKSHAVIKAVKQYFCEVYKRYEEKLVGEDNVKKRRMILFFKGKVSQSDERS